MPACVLCFEANAVTHDPAVGDICRACLAWLDTDPNDREREGMMRERNGGQEAKAGGDQPYDSAPGVANRRTDEFRGGGR